MKWHSWISGFLTCYMLGCIPMYYIMRAVPPYVATGTAVMAAVTWPYQMFVFARVAQGVRADGPGCNEPDELERWRCA